MMKLLHFPILLFCFLMLACSNDKSQKAAKISKNNSKEKNTIPFESDAKTIHIFVALCDNKYQGIVPVPDKIGNGQDPDNNLYWGSAFGVRSYFKKSKEWKLVETRKLKSEKLERIIFKHITKNYYLVADAYDGKFIKEATVDFLNSSSGNNKDTLKIRKTTIGIGGNSKLLAYVGHDGLMDFQLNETFENTDKVKRDVIILACYSKNYFSPHLAKANVNPLVWTINLMAPEAYTLHDAISGYLLNESNGQIRTRAAKAYSKYQKCSEKAARNLLVTSW
ncbi:hypothetical protein OMO38_10670 [Chryseobacterium sp. 09-1422]|uniref:Uncharacterized protein n=1 Tax=Chryseobacterium kimseyorum TaxID=2984028 RepID=A0ABT3HYW1_9FLAO|nr:hypothetical protein [Chryseobacterium kimseyorum]MCW3168986.1 hypothetical protein [Chryseobacterium kimseyorum]